MTATRSISNILKARPTIEGAGVRLKRVFGFNEVPTFDPFLLLDDFTSDDPDDYRPGFPWHPHRGIETVTYIMNGAMRHEDSLGNKGIIRDGDVQWMTAGSGIIHSEMPAQDRGLLKGLQLWVNLPRKRKMSEPRYRDITGETVPEAIVGDRIRVKILAGEFAGITGPARDIAVQPLYLDIAAPPGSRIALPVPRGHTVFAYVIDGTGRFGPGSQQLGKGALALLSDGNEVDVQAGEDPLRFILVAGRPIGEPVAWEGPIVMNTPEELSIAFEEYRAGTFLKHGKKK
jgi:quercetin 2,3-dioxygenase